MPRPAEWAENEIGQLQAEIKRLTTQRNTLAYNSGKQLGEAHKQLRDLQAGAGLVVHALNCAVQLTEALIAYMPDGSPMHPDVARCKNELDCAMRAINGSLRNPINE